MPRRGHLGGHRVIIASLYLPDTLQFSEPELDHAFTESPEESTAPPSPDSVSGEPSLSIHELSSRLAACMKHGTDTIDPRSSSAPVKSAKHRQSSFSGKKINMSELMYEASAFPRPDGAVSGPPSPKHRSRRASMSEHIQTPTDIPVAPASDHGRVATALDAITSGVRSTSPLAPPKSASTQLASGQKSRRTSFNTGGVSGQALSQPSAPIEGPGTQTPGAQAGGKQGMTIPLSIISDMAAKRGGPIPQVTTPGDSERHHPFGSGAVTPKAGSQTPGHANRSSHNATRGFGGLNPSALSMTKANGTGAASGPSRPGLSASQSTLAVPSQTASKSSSTTFSSHERASSAVASGSIIDHGRGAAPNPATPAPEQPSLRPRSSQRAEPKERSATISPSPSLKGRNLNVGSTRSPHAHGASSAFGRNRSIRAAPRLRHSARASSAGRSGLGRRTSTTSIDTANDQPSNLPPFDFVPNPAANGGLINAVRSIERDKLRAGKLYVGTVGIDTEGWLGPGEKREIELRYRKERSSVPVWVDDDDFDSSYNQFCKQILWPTFHYTLPTSKGLESEQEAFRAYVEVNRRFADAIEDSYQEGDIVWVNDYHLLLVPQMVRERLPHATIGLFVHVAFPSSEIFRCLSVRETLLKGMLGADLVGFQTHNFCRHFRQTVSRILQLEATPKGVQLDGSFVTVSPFPIGIDVRSLNAKRQDPEVQEWVSRLREKYSGKRIVVGRDKLDWIKGVRQKLLAFETFLDEHPQWAGEVVLIQVALATTEENEEIGEATDVVARINNKYSSLTYQPVVFLHVQDITFSQYLALLTVADCFLATSLREGMNLTSHEYVVCQEVRHRPLILSEFTGTYSGLRACIGINPWNTKQVANAIHKALTMDESEMVQRWTDLHRVVVTQTAQHWITSLLGHLERAHLEQERLENMFVPRLEVAQLVSEWRAAHSRLLLIDLEETLVKLDPAVIREQGGFEPPEWLIKLLTDLTSDRKNVVYVLSGLGTDDLAKLANAVEGVGFVAENGCFVKHVRETYWNSLVAAFDLRPIREILNYFTERTPGSYIEERGASMCWRFWNQDDDMTSSHEAQWARRQSAEVANLIHERFSHSLRVVHCKTSCLIMPRYASRASAVQHIIMQMSVLGTVSIPTASGSSSTLPTPSAVAQRLPDQPHHPPLDSAYKQPSNYWPLPVATTAHSSPVQHSSPRHRGSVSHGVHHGHHMGQFDFVLALGQDEKLLAYVNTLDLFAPVTCTTVDLEKNRGTEATYFLAPSDVRQALEEIINFRARDLKWAHG
ncbi:Trehalose-6-P synthase/phosphatase complex subunit [Thecaphora frezii]